MTSIILFHGLGSSAKLLNYIYHDNKYHANNFVEQLKQITSVTIPTIPYTNMYYYTNMKQMYKPIDELNYDDLSLDKYITKLHVKLKTKGPYILMGHSHGIYYACEFARQYKHEVQCIVSLDGSWITPTLNKQRMTNWKKKGKTVKPINNQQTLNAIVHKIKTETDNMEYINAISNYVRYTHTKWVIKQNYPKILQHIPFVTFRDFNVAPTDSVMTDYNANVLQENNILANYDNQTIFTLLDATHMIWLHNHHKKTILKTIKIVYTLLFHHNSHAIV